MEHFDPASGKWTSLPSIPTARYACGGVAIGGCLYVIGGLSNSDQALNTLEAYDPQLGKWSLLPPMPTARFDCAVAELGGQLFVIGGRNNLGQILNIVECYNPKKGTWTTLPELVAPRFGCGASSIGNTLYVFGGWDVDAVSRVEELDLGCGKELTWNSKLPTMPTARGGCAVTVISR